MKLHFDNSFARLPVDFYSEQLPIAINQPHLVHANTQVATLLGINSEDLNCEDFIQCFSGNLVIDGSQPLAMVYAGHQFGTYVPQLGDGRALLLGEIVNQSHQRWDIQLKGSGKTPYSRMGDGRAVLRSTLREYLCSEAMHALGIPTTRALCIIETNEPVYREFPEPGAILTRVSESHIRFGHFEFFYYTNQHQALKQLADYVLQRHYPEQLGENNGYLYLFEQAVIKTARLIAQWQAVGFCHGVMNTDNMSILGLTIDYGPFGFLDTFNPHHISNSSDYSGRYAYNKQPGIAYWNLTALAQALTPLIAIDKLNGALELFEPEFMKSCIDLYRQKLGLKNVKANDGELIGDLLQTLALSQVDYTNFFRGLPTLERGNNPQLNEWLQRYQLRLEHETTSNVERKSGMEKANPCYVLRNHLAQQAIEQAYEYRNYQEIDRLFKILQNPFDEQEQYHDYTRPPNEQESCLKVSCSS